LVSSDNNAIIAHELTDYDTYDSPMIGGLAANSGCNIGSLIGADAYDGAPVYKPIRAVWP
jgi:hypothetical protein